MSENSKKHFSYTDYKLVPQELYPVDNTLFVDSKVEKEVLALMLKENDRQDLVFGYLDFGAFAVPEYATLYRLMKQTYLQTARFIDYFELKDLIERFKSSYEFNILSLELLNNINSKLYNPDNLNSNLERLLELQKIRTTQSFTQNLLNTLATNKKVSWDDLSTDISNLMTNISKLSLNNSDFIDISQAVDAFEANLNKIIEGKSITNYLPTGFNTIDKVIKGFMPGQLIVLAARPAIGKTALALNIALNVVLNAQKNNEQKNVAFISLEMPSSEITTRILSTVSNVEMHKLHDPAKFLRDDIASIQKLSAAYTKLKESDGLFLDDNSKSTINDIKFKIKHLMKSNDNKLDLVIIDYLQLISSNLKGGNRQNEVAQISRELKTLALELKIPILTLSQLSRNVENRENKRPQLHDLKESGAIEQDADIVIFLSKRQLKRKEGEDAPKLDSISINLDIAKNRNGITSNSTIIYTGKNVKFTDENSDYEV
ncbi:DnaB-like helicase C-terminal domain-containing protein [Mycoplasma nasistruthionis]|uniref:DNA helicase n=1 Tax=Mycoplasma nasistruthionis TaxID=353852 RepID=A0A4Y6I6X0_9MOLU|nr:DnaB-like helicase C-terminal domain-containing protein [Mycoplasma nasistruthionis]QDF65060.1 DNA helicase [Mycoplasma nasistruthionis]